MALADDVLGRRPVVARMDAVLILAASSRLSTLRSSRATLSGRCDILRDGSGRGSAGMALVKGFLIFVMNLSALEAGWSMIFLDLEELAVVAVRLEYPESLVAYLFFFCTIDGSLRLVPTLAEAFARAGDCCSSEVSSPLDSVKTSLSSGSVSQVAWREPGRLALCGAIAVHPLAQDNEERE